VTVRVKDPAGVGQQSVIFDICEYGLVFARNYDSLRSWVKTHTPFELTEVSEPLKGYRHWIVNYGKKKLVKEIERAGVGKIRIFMCSDYQIEDASSLSLEQYIEHANDIYADYNPSGGMILAIRDQLPEKGLSCIEYVPLRGRSAGKLSTVYFLNSRIMACAGDVLIVERNMAFRRSVLPNLWTAPNAALHMEGCVTLISGKKPESLLYKVISNLSAERDLVLDFFVGSGTAAAVAHKTNRRWVAVEGENSVFHLALKRLKLVLSGEKSGISKQVKWQGGGFFKCQTLEQYEDALNNLSFDESSGQMALQFEDYLLKYMLTWETRRSETLLNVEKLSKPFDYALHIHHNGETQVQKVDLPETFNYLIGLDVETRKVLDNNGKHYLVYRGVSHEGRRTAVIWRETEGWKEDDYHRDRDFVVRHKLTEGADEVFVNGDSFIPGAQALDGVFKAKMFAGVEV